MIGPGHPEPGRPDRTLHELLGFLVVGVAATLTHLGVGLVVFYGLDLGVGALAANFIAFCVAYLVSYFGNAKLTFPDTRLGPASFFRFLAVSLTSLGLNQALVFALVEVADRPYWQALIVVLMVVPPLTFLAMKYWGVGGGAQARSRPGKYRPGRRGAYTHSHECGSMDRHRHRDRHPDRDRDLPSESPGGVQPPA